MIGSEGNLLFIFGSKRIYNACVWVGGPVLGVEEFSSPRYLIFHLLPTRDVVGLERSTKLA